MATKLTTESARNDTGTARTPGTWANQIRAFAERSLQEITRSRIMLFWVFGFPPAMYLLYTVAMGRGDLSVIQAVHAIIREQRAADKTVVITSHLPMDADLADRIAFLRAGKIVATDTPENLMASLPPVVRVSSTEAASMLTDHVVGGELFSDGGEVRGFLREDREVSDIDVVVNDTARSASRPDTRAAIETKPTYTDLFNYYTKLELSEAH